MIKKQINIIYKTNLIMIYMNFILYVLKILRNKILYNKNTKNLKKKKNLNKNLITINNINLLIICFVLMLPNIITFNINLIKNI